MDYLDFEVEVAVGDQETYQVSVVASPAGEAHAQMRFPYDRLALENKIQALQIALLRTRGVRRGINETDSVRDLGRDLYGALFAGDVASRLEVTQSIARSQGRGVRIKLRIDAPELLGLPWEYMYDAASGDYLALAVSTPVVRYLPIPQQIEPLEVGPPLRILAMTSGPKDLGTLDVGRERQRLDLALDSLRKRGLVELEWVPGESWEDLQQALWNGPWHVFHFVGHGGFNERKEAGVIYLTGDDGNAKELPAIDVARLLGDHEPLRLAILNSCETAQGAATDVFSSTAAALVRKGTPAVVAMQFQITDDAAIQFSKVFYAAMAHGMPVDSAVSEARKAVALQLGTYEWGTPVLFMRSPDGVLFRVPPSVQADAEADVAKAVDSPPLSASATVQAEVQQRRVDSPPVAATASASSGDRVAAPAAPTQSAPVPVAAAPPLPPSPGYPTGPAVTSQVNTPPPAGYQPSYSGQPAALGSSTWPAANAPPRRRSKRAWIVGGAVLAVVLSVGGLIGLASRANARPSLVIWPTAGRPGATVSVYGSNFSPMSRVLLGWSIDNAQTSIFANSNGYFSTSISVPDDAPSGDMDLVASDATGNDFYQLFSVFADVVASSASGAGPVGGVPDQDVIDGVCTAERNGAAISSASYSLQSSLQQPDPVAAEHYHDSLMSVLADTDAAIASAAAWTPMSAVANELRSSLADWGSAMDTYYQDPSLDNEQAASELARRANSDVIAWRTFHESHPELGPECWVTGSPSP